MRQMLEAGVHFGHQTRYWNPKMAQYIFGHRNKIHIINLEKTLALYQEALKFARQLAANRGMLLFVGTKRQARDIVREEAQRCQKGAVAEAVKLGIPVIGVVDTNHSPEGIDYIIPGNDDSSRAIRLYARGLADAVLEGRTQSLEEVTAASRDEFVEVEEDAGE